MIAELDAGIQICAQVTIGDAGPFQPGQAVLLEATAVDPDSHAGPPQPGVAPSFPARAPVLFSDPAALAPTATFPVRAAMSSASSPTTSDRDHLCRAPLHTGAPSAGFAGWIDGFQGIPATGRGPLDDALRRRHAKPSGLWPRARSPRPSAWSWPRGPSPSKVRADDQLVVTLRIPEGLHTAPISITDFLSVSGFGKLDSVASRKKASRLGRYTVNAFTLARERRSGLSPEPPRKTVDPTAIGYRNPVFQIRRTGEVGI